MKVLFFKAPWCSACHAIEEHVPEWCEHIDCQDDPDSAVKYGVNSLPVFIAIDDNDAEISRIQTTSMPALKNWYNSLVKETENVV